MKKLMRLTIVILALIIAITPLSAQPSVPADTPAFATVIDNQLWIYPAEGDPFLVETGDVQSINSMAWSPDGQTLAYIAYSPDYTPELYAYQIGQSTPVKVAEKLETAFPVNFTSEGNRVLYAKFSEQSDPENGTYKVDVISSPILDRSAPITLGTFDLGVGCGGGSTIPADWVYNEETASLGGFYLTLQETPFGILHSSECGGSRIGLLNPETGENITISENLGRVKVSPDKSKAAGIELNVSMEGDQVIRDSRLLVVDLATLEITEVPTTGEPQQLAWSTDGSEIFYSTKDQSGDLYADLTPEQRTALDTALGFSFGVIESYTSTINRVNVESGESSQVFSGDAYAIGRMIAVGDSLYFSQIPNLNGWVNAIVNGEVDFSGTLEDQRRYVEPVVSRLDLSSGEVTPIGTNLGQFTPIVQ